MEEVTLDDYVLTNLNLRGKYTIRLKDDKGYVVYKGKTDYIVKEGKHIPLSQEVNKFFLSSVREYERYGI